MIRFPSALFTGLALLVPAGPAYAYMGPGIGLGAVSTALSILGALVLGLISIFWYPAKRVVRRIRRRSR